MNWAQFFMPPTPLLPLSPPHPPLASTLEAPRSYVQSLPSCWITWHGIIKAPLKNLGTKKVAIENPINEFFNANVMTLRVGIQFCETAPCRADLCSGVSCHTSSESVL
jgi:hypothetical protein